MCEEGAVSNQLFTWWHHSYSNNNLKNCGQIILLQANHSNINQRVADEHTETSTLHSQQLPTWWENPDSRQQIKQMCNITGNP